MSTPHYLKKTLRFFKFWRLVSLSRILKVTVISVVGVVAFPGIAFALYSALSSTQTAGVTASKVSPPTNFTANAASSTTATLSWTAPANLTGYTLSQSPGTISGAGGSPCAASLSAATTTCTAANLVPGTNYAWTLVAKYDSWASSSVQASTTPPKETPNITTTDNPASLTVGGSGDDQATVSSGYFTAGSTGTITFKLYNNSSCTGTPLFVDSPQTVTGLSTYTSNSYTTSQAGTDYWYFTYTGDSSNNPVSECGGAPAVTGEVLTVNKASPTLKTTGSSATIGGSISDSADLENGYSPSGSITFNLYSTSSCSTTALYTNTVTVNGNGSNYDSGNYTPTSAGTYYWTATYSSDTNNSGVNDVCGSSGESSVVSKASPTLSTTATPASITIGGSGADQATLTGGYSPTGTMTFSLYQGSCGGTPIFTTTQSTSQVVNGNTVYTSASYTPTLVGAYYWSASYPGDSNNNAATDACSISNGSETLTVNKASPTLLTALNAASITVGGTDFDTATLTGAVDIQSGGTVTFSYYTNNTCTQNQVTVNQVTVAINGTVPNSGSVNFNRAGTYYWQAVYSGDANNNSAASPCTATNNEQLTVNKASPVLSTQLNATSITAGSTDFDTATLSGAVNIQSGGTVTFSYYTNNTCSAGQASAGTVTVATNGNVPNSNTITFNSGGTYYWQAVYSGDANNNGYTTACNVASETLTVSAVIGASDIGDNSATPCTSLNTSHQCVGPSVTTTNGATELIFIYDKGSQNSAANASSVTSPSFTANATSVNTESYANPNKNEVDVWLAKGNGSTGAVTATFASNEGTSDLVITVVQLSGNNVSSPVAQSTVNLNSSGNTTASTTAFTSTPAVGDAEIVFFGANNNVSVATPSGFTKLLEVNNATGGGNAEGIYFNTTAQTTAVSSTLGSSSPWASVALDLAHA